MTAIAAIMADYKTEPYFHQLRELEVSAELPARALLWTMRTGKTKIIIDTSCHLWKQGLIDAVLVFAPNGVHENWIRRELPTHHWDTVPHIPLAWRTSEAGASALKESGWRSKAYTERLQEAHARWHETFKRIMATKELTWLSFNSESMTRDDVRKLVAKYIRHRRVLVVFDESHNYRSPSSKRTHMARALAKRCPYRRILTGTPVTNSPLHAWGQFELLEPGALGFSKFGDFEKRYATYRTETKRNGQKYPVLDGYQNLDELRDRLAPWSSVVLREDCDDMPDIIRTARRLELSAEQVRLYRELHSAFELEVKEGELVSIGENTARLMKLQQVTSGFLIDEFRDVHNVQGSNPRLEVLSEEVYLSPGRVIVWCQFREDLDRVSARLRADGHEVAEYHGRTSSEERQKVREAFAPGSDSETKVLVGQPQAGGTGLDLSGAGEIIWYSHTFDAIVRGQADERATKVKGGNVAVTDLVAPGIDDYILEKVAAKLHVADGLTGYGMREALGRVKI